ncbi:E3 ubiquitin-protein ligase BRE1B-like [Opisthocomus hoazin]|uniref:E3 ubiquitin-protein ligase BRE1B-like n=1 Tax=Opisthocomus hoazin TaxID=30419 RepID=UPI003F53E31A
MFRVVGPSCSSRGTSTLRASGDPNAGVLALQGGFLVAGVVAPIGEVPPPAGWDGLVTPPGLLQAVEAAQLAEDLRAQGEHVQARLRELQACAAENRAAKDKESLSLKRAQEELSRLRRKLEKQRKVEVYADADQILQEEIKEYRARLTCPCCNARKKDAVLTKCFHVFCFECVKSRYDTRQRKCPKCNAAFGAHDFHRVYIS